MHPVWTIEPAHPQRASALAREDFGVLLFDYRGYAGQDGTPSEDGLAADARAALEHVRSRPDVDPQRIAYYGESLGAAVAIGLAFDSPPAALVLRSPFTSLEDMARLHYPWLPIGPLLAERSHRRRNGREGRSGAS